MLRSMLGRGGCAGGIILASAVLWPVCATQPPRPGTDAATTLSEGAQKKLNEILRYNTTAGLTALVRRARANVRFNAEIRRLGGGLRGPAITLPTAVQGTREIPVLTATFADTPANPYPVANLQKELFDGPWPTGTMTDYYKEISYGKFTVTGTVSDWIKLGEKGSVYAGPPGCNAMCPESAANFAKMITDVLTSADASLDFTKYDNDGEDGKPNSGDDDGVVDFVAIVHPQIGGECRKGDSIWSHRYSLTSLTGQDFETADTGLGGIKIRVNDYVVMPALACDGSTMIQIGVFAHEFGHAFGLPDLYDTDDTNGDSQGIGGWGLMGGGSWGGDQKSPERPSHMEVWSKEYLGWVKSTDIKIDTPNLRLRPTASNPEAWKIDIDQDRAFMLENRAKEGFDASLPGSGLVVWRVKNSVITPGLLNNKVNADESNQGLAVVEADGRSDLNNSANAGDDGDVFPGAKGTTIFAKNSNPASTGNIALCNIRKEGKDMVVDVLISSSQCPYESSSPGAK